MADLLATATTELEKAIDALKGADRVTIPDGATSAEISVAVDLLAAEKDKLLDLALAMQSFADAVNNDVAAAAAEQDEANTNSGMVIPTGPTECDGDDFQGIRFYDGTSFGYLRVFEDEAELVIGSKSLTFPIDGTVEHTYRITGKGRDIKLYVDGQIAIDGTGELTSHTTEKLIEFGDIAGRNQLISSSWSTFKYSVLGAFSPNSTNDVVLEDVAAFPAASVGRLKEYKDRLYMSVDPVDSEKSSAIYAYKEGFESEPRTAIAITKASVSAVVVDPSRDSSLFATSGKFIGTDRGVQYILGGKPFPFDAVTLMSSLPSENGWQVDSNCESDPASSSGNVLTIDTTAETGARFFKYMQNQANDPWVKEADNVKGWTVEVRVKILADGTNGSIDAAGAAAAAVLSCDNCGQCDETTDDGLRAPGIFINDGTYQEFVQFFQKGIRLRNARLFAPQTLSDQFYTVRIIGKGTAMAVYAKGDTDKAFRKVLFSSNALTVKAVPTDRQEQPCVVIDELGAMHVVWQDASGGDFAIFYSKLTGKAIERGSGLVGSRTIDVDASIINARVGFGLPPAASGIDYKKLAQNVVIAPSASFVRKKVKAGDLLYIFGKGVATRSYVISDVVDEILLKLDTKDDLGGLLSSEWVVATADQKWLPASRVSMNSLDSVDPRMLIHSSGDVFVAYSNNQDGNDDVYIRRGKPEPFGITWAETLRVTNSSKNATAPDIMGLPNGDIYVVWEDASTDATSSLIFAAAIPFASFGSVTNFKKYSVQSGVHVFRSPRLAKVGNTIIVAYEDQSSPLHSIMVSEGSYSASDAKKPVSFSLHQTISDSEGQSRNPSIAAGPDGSFYVAWEDHALIRGQIVASVRGTSGEWSAPFRVSNTSGSSREPVVATDGSGNAYIAFCDDKTRDRYFEVYVAKFDKAAGEWLCSGQRGLDTKIRSYLSDNRRPSLSVGPDGALGLAWEAYKDGSRTVIAGARFNGTSISMDTTIVGYFPMDDSGLDLEVQNKIRTFDSQGVVTPQRAGVAFGQTDLYSVPSSDTGASLYAPEDQKSFDLNDNGFGFKIPGDLVRKAGAIDLRIRPHWGSTAPGEHVFFGNSDMASVTPNTMSCGVTTEVGGNVLKFKVVDEDGLPHETSVDHNHFQWAAEQDVFLRAVWDNKAIGVSSLTCVAFPTASVGYACGYNGMIFKTIDGGATWVRQTVPLTYDIYTIEFLDATTGYAACELGTILRTTDGTHWEAVETGVDADLNAISFRTASLGFAAGPGSTLLKTTDGGETWTQATIADDDVQFNDVYAVGAGTNVLAVANSGKIYRSTDDGDTFESVDSGTTVHLNAISRGRSLAGLNCYVAGAAGVVLSTTDEGETWTDVSPAWGGFAYKPTLHGIAHSANTGVCWVVGQGGAMARTTDSGASWTTIATQTDGGALRSVEAFFDGATGDDIAIAVGISGLVLSTTDAGATKSYTHTMSANVTLYINGIELVQTRTNDLPFEWEPELDLFVGDYRQSGADATADAVFDELIVYKEPPPSNSAHRRQEIQSYQAITSLVVSGDFSKKIEWGSISPDIKTNTQWKEFKMFFCGAKEPLLHFAWDSGIGLVDDVIRDFALDGTDLWIATENGVSRMDTASANGCINSWLSGQPVADPDLFTNYTNLANGLLADSVNSICIDGLGNVWAATNKGAMMMVSQRPESDSSTEADPVGTTLGGGDVINDADAIPKFSLYLTTDSGLPSNRVNVIRSNGGTVFLGTDAGLVLVDLAKLTVSESEATLGEDAILTLTTKDGLPSNLVRAIAFDDKTGQVWVGTDKGAVNLKPGCNEVVGRVSAVRNNDVHSITIDSQGRKFIGTRLGLTMVDGVESRTFTASDGLPASVIMSGSFDAAGALWLGTSAGLLEYNEDCSKFTTYGIQDGIIGDPAIIDFKHYRILGGPLPFGGCEKALVSVAVNGVHIADGFTVNPAVPAITFDTPLVPSDVVDVRVDKGWRKVRDFNSDSRDVSFALLETDVTKFRLYRKRFSAGSVVLGGNFAQGAANSSTHMYVVFAKPLAGPGSVIDSVQQPVTAAVGTAIEGEAVYSDVSEPIEVLPTDLVSAEMITMESTDSGDISDSYLEFTLSADAVVYVAYDDRSGNVPNWLRSFEPVRQVLRVSDMENFTDGSGSEKMFVATRGSTGCVYSVLVDPEICDASAEIAMDAAPPTGCATIASVSATDTISLKLQATDAVTGVVDMQVSPRPDFTTDGTTAVPYEPFQSTYTLTLPASQTNVEIPVTTLSASQGTANLFFDYNGTLLIGTSLPGNVYALDKSTNSISLLVATGEDEVLSMAQFGSYLIIGTGGNGLVFSWDGTTLQQVGVSVGDSADSMIAFDSSVFIGSSPLGKIYQLDDALSMTLFRDTNETSVSGFAVFGGRLYYSTTNDFVAENDVLSTNTVAGHRHTIVAQAGSLRLGDVSGTTSTAAGHSHAVVNGVVQEEDGHTHELNGVRSGKIFSYDAASQEVNLRHADRDYAIVSLTASTGDDAEMFAGTSPNGKILRFAPEDGVFIKSFDTTASTVGVLRSVGANVYAAADEDIFYFDGTRWQFSSGSDESIVDFIGNGDSVLLLKEDGITSSKPASVNEDKTLCAYVRFRDAAGNVTALFDSTGKQIECYNPCVKLKDVINPDGTDQPPVSHRIVEIDGNANVLSSISSSEPFFSGEKVEEEVGVYESEVFNGTNSLIQWVNLTWEGVVAAGSSITIAVRSARTQAEIASAEWSDEFTTPTANDLTNLVGQFLQFRATLKVSVAGVPSPELNRVDIQLRTSQAVHYFTTNFLLPDELRRGILAYNGCINPPVTDVVFGISGLDSTNFSDYMIIEPGKVFEVSSQHQTKNMRIGIKLISSPQVVPVVDEFALLFSLANDAYVKLNLAGQPGATSGPPIFTGSTRTVPTDQVQGHVHTVTFASTTTDKASINGSTSINAEHSHLIVNGVIQPAAGHTHDFTL